MPASGRSQSCQGIRSERGLSTHHPPPSPHPHLHISISEDGEVSPLAPSTIPDYPPIRYHLRPHVFTLSRSSMQICLVSEHYHPHVGGIEHHVAGLGKGLSDLGHKVTVVTPNPGPETVDGIPVRRVRVPLVPVVNIPYTPLGILPLEDLLRSGSYDLVHCHHSIVSPGVACAAYLAQRMGTPTVVTFHSLLDGYSQAFRLLNALSGWSRWPAVFTAVSTGVAAGLQSVLPNREIPILPCGVNEEFWRTSTGKGPEGREVVLVSTLRLARRKRPLALIQMVARLREALPEGFPLRVRIIGGGPERRKVERSIASLGLEEMVELTGEMDHEGIREAYARASVFVQPSEEESFGLAALEARAAGLPVVARRGSGLAGFIREGENGFLADSDEEMIAFLLQLLSNDALCEQISFTNRTTRPPMSWPQVLDCHMEAYSEARRLSVLNQPALP
jgi:glycosyltransferase involved in cell wall biosynthesis